MPIEEQIDGHWRIVLDIDQVTPVPLPRAAVQEFCTSLLDFLADELRTTGGTAIEWAPDDPCACGWQLATCPTCGELRCGRCDPNFGECERTAPVRQSRRYYYWHARSCGDSLLRSFRLALARRPR